MKRRLTLATFASAILAASAAHAGTAGYYVSGMAGGSFLPDLHLRTIDTGIPQTGFSNENFDNGYAMGGGAGYDSGDGWRVGVESLYQRPNLELIGTTPARGHLTTTSLMVNGTYDLMPNATVTPYAGAGIGLQSVGGTIDGYEGHQWKPAYQVEAGLRAQIAPNTELFGEYRFTQSEAARLGDPTDPATTASQHFSNHALLAGVTYKFSDLD